MKFKRDYKITVEADMNDEVFWSATHKGEPMSSEKSIEDYETISIMLESARRRITDVLAHKRLQTIPVMKIVSELQVHPNNFNEIQELLNRGVIWGFCYENGNMTVTMQDKHSTVENGGWIVEDVNHAWWCMDNNYHRQMVNMEKLILVKEGDK